MDWSMSARSGILYPWKRLDFCILGGRYKMVVLVRNELTLNEISDSARSQVKKNWGFSAVFREYEIRALATKGLKSACLFIHGISIFKIT